MRAIDADDLKTAFPVCDNSKSVLIASVRATINHMPTIEPQRKKGKWINCDGGIATCSVCGDRWGVYGVMNFCPNCGAEMTEESEEPKKCDTCKHEKERWFSRCADCSDYELWESKE